MSNEQRSRLYMDSTKDQKRLRALYGLSEDFRRGALSILAHIVATVVGFALLVLFLAAA